MVTPEVVGHIDPVCLVAWVWTSQSTSSLLRNAFSFYVTLTPLVQVGGSG